MCSRTLNFKSVAKIFHFSLSKYTQKVAQYTHKVAQKMHADLYWEVILANEESKLTGMGKKFLGFSENRCF